MAVIHHSIQAGPRHSASPPAFPHYSLEPCELARGMGLLVEVIINTARPQTNLFATHLKQFHEQRNKSLTELIENFRSDTENNYNYEFSMLRVVHLLHKVTGHANSE